MTAGKTAPFTFGRACNLHPSNLGVNVPIMQVIENNTTGDINITQVAGFVSSIAPSVWFRGNSYESPRRVSTAGGDVDARFTWASPVGGRDLLDGIKVHFGNSRLSVMKIIE